jgi:hypothetical protein
LGVANTSYALFVLWPRALGTGTAFSTDVFALMDYVRDRSRDKRVFLDANAFDGHGAVLFALRTVPAQFLDTNLMLLTAADVEHLALEDSPDGNKAISFWLPDKRPTEIGVAPSFTVGGAHYLSYSFESAHGALPSRSWLLPPTDAVIGGELRITGVSISPRLEDAQTELILRWEPVKAPSDDFTLSLRMVNGSGETLAQNDSRLGGAYVGTRVWRPGDVVYTKHTLPLPEHSVEPLELVAVTYSRGPPLRTLQVEVNGELRGELLRLGAFRVAER